MDGFKKYKLELLLVGYIAALPMLIVYSSSDPLVDLILKLALIADAVMIISTLLRLWSTKWRHALGKVARKVFIRAAEAFMRLLETLNIKSRRKTILMGETRVVFNIDRGERKKKDPLAKKKWRQIDTPRDKLRYIYRHTVSEQIKHGERIYSCHTPNELRDRDINGEGERAMFEMYATYRYDSRREPDEAEVSELKAKYFEGLK